MKSKTAFNHQQRLLSRIKDIYSSAKIYQISSSSLIAKKKSFYESEPCWKKLPEHVRSYLSGYDTCLWDKHWELVMWSFNWEGVEYSGWNELPESGKEAIRQNKLSGHHIYIKEPHREYTTMEVKK